MTSPPMSAVDERVHLAQAAVNILKNEELVPKGKRWPFPRSSKAHKDYERAVQDITARRRAAREHALDDQLRRERAAADATFDRAKSDAEATHRERMSQARKPYEETEATARSERDAAIAVANSVYQRAIDAANRVYQAQAAQIDQTRNTLIDEAKGARDNAHAAIDKKREAELQQMARELKLVPLEGPMRVVEDKDGWPLDERKKALIGLVDMAGREDFDVQDAELCLSKVAGYVAQDEVLPADQQHHRLMDVGVLEALAELARRTPNKRPLIVRYVHAVVANHPGHTSPAFIKTLTELYVIASSDAETIYAEEPSENDRIIDAMREQIADALKLTPRRNQVQSRSPSGGPKRSDADITADVDVRELVPVESTPGHAGEAEAIVEGQPHDRGAAGSRPPPLSSGPRRSKRAPVPDGDS